MKITEESVIKNTLFASLAEKSRVRIVAVVTKIDDKETAYAPVKRFRGDIVVATDENAVRAKTAFFPSSISDAILSAAQKIKGWDQLEFVALATKNSKDAAQLWSLSWEVTPRQTAPRVLDLLNR